MQSPFKFLEPYGKSDAAFFYGREKETAQLYNAVHASSLTLLYGASGTGKTSLINCGLANKFYDSDWLPLYIRKGNDDINAALENALNKALAPTETDPHKLSTAKKIEYLFLDYFKPIYIIFDQFEELFIFPKDNEANQFYNTIKTLLETSQLHVKVIIVIREEWIAYLNEFEKVVPYLFDNRLRIEKMNTENLKNVVWGTLTHVGVKVSEPIEETIELILNNIRDKKTGVELTNLQVYLDRLYREATKYSTTDAIVFTPSVIEAVGAMDNVISSFLDEELANIEKGLATELKVRNPKGVPLEILFTLVSDDQTKRSATINQILTDLPQKSGIRRQDVEYCLNAFKRIRILRETE